MLSWVEIPARLYPNSVYGGVIMRYLRWLTVVLASSLLALSACAQQTESQVTYSSGTPDDGGIGYSSVAVALEDLRVQRNFRTWVEDGWTIFYDDDSLVMWNFTSSNHPAHPAAVKRRLWEENGDWLHEMRVLCQAGRDACDKLVADFQELNDQMKEYIRRESEPGKTEWAPSEQQKSRADETLSQFLQANDEARYRDAYGLLTPGMKSLMTFAEFVEHEQYFHDQFGGDPVRSNIRVT